MPPMNGHSLRSRFSVEGDATRVRAGFTITRDWPRDETLVSMLDHAYLNDIEGLENPTMENMAAWFGAARQQLPGLAKLSSRNANRSGSYRGP